MRRSTPQPATRKTPRGGTIAPFQLAPTPISVPYFLTSMVGTNFSLVFGEETVGRTKDRNNNKQDSG